MTFKTARYGWKPQHPDWRDHPAPMSVAPSKLPASVDLRPKDSPIYDQGQLGSCTGNATAGAIQFGRRREGLPDFIPSRLFAYYNGRAIEGTVDQDAGAEIRDVVKAAAKLGDCPESEWPYDISQFATQPSSQCYADALHDRVLQYYALHQTAVGVKTCLALGYPAIFGFSVYESFESEAVASTGIVPMPSASENIVGGHAVMAIGYDDTQHKFIVRNSWGKSWGASGYCFMDYDYLLNPGLASDWWMLQVVSKS